MSKKRKVVLLLLAGVVVAVAAAVSLSSGKRDVVKVTVAPVKVQDVVGKVIANGKIQAENRVELSALVMGQIVNLRVKEGDAVRKGDFLLQIDRNRAAADEAGSAAALEASGKDRDSARTALEQARLDYERARSNYEARIASEAEFQRAQNAFESARSALAAAQSRVDQTRASLAASRDTLSKTTIVSPIDGVVTTLRVKAGEVTVIGTMNNPGTQLMTISDMSSVQAVLMVDETDTTSVEVGQKALLSIDAYSGRTFEGVVTEVGHSPILRDDTDLAGLTTTSDAINFKVRVKLLEPPPRIRPGFSATADIITGTKASVPTVPLAAVVVRDAPDGKRNASGKLATEQGVFVVKDGASSFAPLTTGLAGELAIEVISGPAEGTEVVTGPFGALRKLKDGTRVEVMTEKERKVAEEQGAS